MLEHARNLEFEKAARVRDQLAQLREQAFGAPGVDNVAAIAPGIAASPSGPGSGPAAGFVPRRH
jgi:excinuclease ABC subunit B